MSTELAHQKADKHLCVALRYKVRISYTLLWHCNQKSLLNDAISRENTTLFLNLCSQFFYYSIILFIFALAIRKERKTYCSMVSQSPHEKRRAIQLKLGLPHYGRRLPISVVVCGEPRDLWRMFAPILFYSI